MSPIEVLSTLADEPCPFLLESRLAVGGLGRLTLVGARPSSVMSIRVGDAPDPFAALAEALGRPGDWLAVGFLGYDLRLALEDLPASAVRDTTFPDLHLAFYEEWGEYDEAERRWLRDPPPWGLAVPPSSTPRAGRPVPALDRAGYMAAVRRVTDYIRAGDIFQANVTLRFEAPFAGRPLDLYGRLREVNPAPFAAFMDMGSQAIVSSSPERFLRVQGGRVETRPIKGTRPRTGDAGSDRIACEALLASEKDNAELAMIVDVSRNDLGRVCRPGSVVVAEPRVMEEHPTVYHLAATVRGDLSPGLTAVDAVRAAFPAASITGAPKIRAMQVIDEVEPVRRSVYTGAIGYFRPGGECDLSVAIRTVLVDGPRAFVQVGGGIVADSDPEAEYAEAMDKGRALFRALGVEPACV